MEEPTRDEKEAEVPMERSEEEDTKEDGPAPALGECIAVSLVDCLPYNTC